MVSRVQTTWLTDALGPGAVRGTRRYGWLPARYTVSRSVYLCTLFMHSGFVYLDNTESGFVYLVYTRSGFVYLVYTKSGFLYMVNTESGFVYLVHSKSRFVYMIKSGLVYVVNTESRLMTSWFIQSRNVRTSYVYAYDICV